MKVTMPFVLWVGDRLAGTLGSDSTTEDVDALVRQAFLMATEDRDVALLPDAGAAAGERPGTDAANNMAVGELLAVIEAQHGALDTMLAMVARLDRSFLPTESGSVWQAVVAGHKAIKRLRGE